MRLAGVRLAVDDPSGASDAYRLLLGVEPATVGGVARFQLERGAVELAAGGGHAIRFVLEPSEAPPVGLSFHGVDVRFEAGDGAAEATVSPTVHAIDHVVVQSPDPDRAIALWRDRLGLRLALDRPFPERGLRLVFFRSGGITLEVAGSHPPPADATGPDHFFGLTYRVADLEAHRARLVAAGVDVSPIRTGMRPGTVVATVRSGTAGIPTLLLQLLPSA